MNPEIVMVFHKLPAVLPLYEAAEARILAEFPDTKVKVGKTQISFSNRYGYAWLWLPFRRMKGRPETYVILSFGLGRREESPRVVEAVEPYPGRWTHHVIISRPEDMDEQVMDWLREAYFFALNK